jgi:predicted AlkP superfamily phosphohydrolase/phosphomutase
MPAVRPLAAATALVLALPASAGAWGFTGHRLVNDKAVDTLPSDLRALFQGNRAWLAEHSIDPDLWRAAGVEGEAPNHFLDMDAFGSYPFPALSHVEKEHLARHGADAREKGRVPWRVAEVYAELVAAFRASDEARALEKAAALGHYVGDAHVPLHAALNYDGQLSGQQGLHNRWESALVENNQVQLAESLLPAAARPPGPPIEAVFAVLLESFSHSVEVLAADKASVRGRDYAETPEDDRYDRGYYSRMQAREAERVRARLSAAASAVGGFWLQAWEEAGRPVLDATFRFPYVRGKTRAVLATLDGAGASLVDAAVARGLMPQLAALRARGAVARGVLTSLPAKTAVGHAALFTGTWADDNGVAGNDVTFPGRRVIDTVSGYSSTVLLAEPVWVTAARQGLRATVASATQVFPFGPFLHERRFGGDYGRNLVLFDGYQNLEAAEHAYGAQDLAARPAGAWLGPLPAHHGEVREFRLEEFGVAVDGLLYDDPGDAVAGFDTMYLALDRDPAAGITLKPAPAGSKDAFRALTLGLGGAQAALNFRLFELAPDGERIVLYRTAPHVLRASRPEVERAAQAATGGFLGNGAEWLYEKGGLGPTLWEGGDGTAEERMLETVSLVIRQFERLADFAWDRTDWDLLVTYLPYPDSVFHVWLGRVDASLPGHDAAVAARLRPYMDRALGLIDGFVGHLAGRAGEDVVLAVGADHGLASTHAVVRPNVLLREAGLLALDADGRVDLARTRAYYARGHFLLVNRQARSGGIVAPAEEAAVRRQARDALLRVRDPATGQAVVLAVLDPSAAGRGDSPRAGGPHGGDLYLSLAPGYEASSSLRGAAVEAAPPGGDHFFDADRPEMHASFAMAGPGVARGADLGLIRQIDVAPTLCALLGIDPPAQATGRVIAPALAHPLPSAPPPSSRDAVPARR